MGREPSNTHPEGEELGNHCHPLERGGVIGRGRPRLCKRRARRQPARQRRTPQLGRMHNPLARRTMEKKCTAQRRAGFRRCEPERRERLDEPPSTGRVGDGSCRRTAAQRPPRSLGHAGMTNSTESLRREKEGRMVRRHAAISSRAPREGRSATLALVAT